MKQVCNFIENNLGELRRKGTEERRAEDEDEVEVEVSTPGDFDLLQPCSELLIDVKAKLGIVP